MPNRKSIPPPSTPPGNYKSILCTKMPFFTPLSIHTLISSLTHSTNINVSCWALGRDKQPEENGPCLQESFWKSSWEESHLPDLEQHGLVVLSHIWRDYGL